MDGRVYGPREWSESRTSPGHDISNTIVTDNWMYWIYLARARTLITEKPVFPPTRQWYDAPAAPESQGSEESRRGDTSSV
jgi:hypothetical protein